jgi:hypothetical protein
MNLRISALKMWRDGHYLNGRRRHGLTPHTRLKRFSRWVAAGKGQDEKDLMDSIREFDTNLKLRVKRIIIKVGCQQLWRK